MFVNAAQQQIRDCFLLLRYTLNMNSWRFHRLIYCLLILAITKEEENYEEAVKAINSCFGGGKPTARLQEILNDPSCTQLSKEVSVRPFYQSSQPVPNNNVCECFIFSRMYSGFWCVQ